MGGKGGKGREERRAEGKLKRNGEGEGSRGGKKSKGRVDRGT